MRELTVIAGPANSGKFPLAKKLLAEDPNRVLVHRDSVRDAIINKMDEWAVTLLMEAMTCRLLDMQKSVVVCAWNLEHTDAAMWKTVAAMYDVPLRWLDTRVAEVQCMIPPLEE